MSTETALPSPDVRKRRDHPPHRGNLLFFMGMIGVICGCLGCFLLPLIVGYPISIATAAMARADLESMEDGMIDPNGKGLSTCAYWIGIGGVALPSIMAVLLITYGVAQLVVYGLP